MFEQAIELIKYADTFAAVKLIENENSPKVIADTYDKLMRHLYNEEKNVAAMVAVGFSGVYYCLHQEDFEIQCIGKTISYNVASFTWPGWDDDGIVISMGEMAIGIDMARLNLRLANELKRGDLPMSRGHWMLGAQLMASGDYDTAVTHFNHAAEYAKKAAKADEVGLAEAFSALSARDQKRLTAALDHLSNEKFEYGQFFIDQVKTAARVFGLG